MRDHVKLDAIYFDGKGWNQTDLRRPDGEVPGELFDLGFRQVEIYDARYGSKRITHHPAFGRQEKDFTVVLLADTPILVLPGDARAKTRKYTKKKAAKKPVKKAATVPAAAEEDDEFVFAPGEYKWR